MNRKINVRAWLLLVVFFIGGLVAFLGTLAYIRPTDKVVMTWKQADDVSYNPPGPFYLSVVEDDIGIGRLPFSTERRYYIYVGRDSGKPIHGHVINYSFHPDVSDLYNLEAHIRKSKVIWSTEGVTFEEASGHKLYIPKSMLGGR